MCTVYTLSIESHVYAVYVYLRGNSKKLLHRKATFSSQRQKPKLPRSHCVAALCASWKPALREQFGDVGHLGSIS